VPPLPPVADRPQLVIFDCDGVLVDSEPLAARVGADLLSEAGWPLTEADVAERFIGRSGAEMHAAAAAELGAPLPEGFDDEFRARFLRLATDELTAVAGVAGVLDRLTQAGIPICVGSNSGRVRVTWTLERTGLMRWFAAERIFSGHDMARPKPAPDVYLAAAASQGVDPAGAAVIEDSAVGAAAARAAGMAVYGYAGGLTPADALSGPGTTVFADMAALPALLGI
jgi:HAD superfamily hydrolase (TIGR01509 family)